MNPDMEQSVTDLCRQLVQTPSESGQEKIAIDVLGDFLSQNRLINLHTDSFGSLVAIVRGKREGPVLLFDGHMDTVPSGRPEVWTRSPFGGQVDGGRLYGRGSSDMKGALAAMAVACLSFLEARADRFAGTLALSATVQEERFEGVAARLVSDFCRPDLVVIGEATGLDLNIGQRGRAEIKLETFGQPAHSSNPEKGRNAVYLMLDLIGRLKALPPPRDPVLGPGILELTDIQSQPYPGASVVPAYCSATWDRRLLAGEKPEAVLAPLVEALSDLGEAAHLSYARDKQICYTGAMMEAERFFPGWLFGEHEWFVEKARRGLQKAGFDVQLSHYGFCTNGSHYAGEKKIPTLGFGPSHEELAHTVDEYIDLDQLRRAVEGYRVLMETFLV